MAGIFSKEYTFFRCGKAAAHHKDILAREKLAVAGGAVGHAPASVLFLPLETNHAGMGAGSQQDAKTFQLAAAGSDGFHITGKLQPVDLCQQELCAKPLGLFPHGFSQRCAAGFLNTGIVDHLCSDGDLAAKVVFLYDDNSIARPSQIQRAGPPPMMTTSYRFSISSITYSCPTKSRLGFNVSAPGCHLAGHTSSPCSATNWQA